MHVRMSLLRNIKIFQKLHFVSVVQSQKTSLRYFQGIEFSMKRVLMQDSEHSRVPNLNVLRGSNHVTFVEADVSD